MQTKADRERKKKEKEERAEREAELAIGQAERDARADELTPHIGKFVQYYDDGWRVGTLGFIIKKGARPVNVRIVPIKTRWMSAAPRGVTVPILNVRPIERGAN